MRWKVPGTYRAAWARVSRIFPYADHGGTLELYGMDGGYDEEALRAARLAKAGMEEVSGSIEAAASASEPAASAPPVGFKTATQQKSRGG